MNPQMQPQEHHPLGPSGAHRWLLCEGSVFASLGAPDTSSAYADEGTDAHELAALTLNSEHHNAHAFIGRVLTKNNVVTEEMAEHVQFYVDYVLRHGGIRYVEVQVDLSHRVAPGVFGTADAVVLNTAESILDVIDLKFGRGEIVQAENNPQLLLYASGVLSHFAATHKWTHVRMHIVQPRVRNPVSVWTLPIVDFEDRMYPIEAKARRIADMMAGRTLDKPVFIAGPVQCRWCKAKGDCKFAADAVREIVTAGMPSADGFANLDGAQAPLPLAPTHVATLTPDDVGRLWRETGFVESWVDSIRKRAYALAMAGSPAPGTKLVLGRPGNREWSDEAAAEELLKSFRLKQDEMYTQKLISPTAAEKVLKESPKRWKKAEALITRSDPKPMLVDYTDKRDAYTLPGMGDGFANLEAAPAPVSAPPAAEPASVDDLL